jgi:hypothetical protein
MPSISHEEIVRQFLGSKSIDFNAIGKFVSEVGPQIALSSSGDYCVRLGHLMILACFNNRVVASPIQSAAGVASEVTGG